MTETAVNPGKRWPAAVVYGLGAVGFAALAAVFGHFGVPWGDSVKFAAGLVAGVYAPGRVLVALLRLDADRLERATLSLVLGMTASTLVYRIAGLAGAAWIFWLWLAAAALAYAILLGRSRPWRRPFSVRVTWTGVGFAVLAGLVFTALYLDNYRNGLTQPDGSVRLHMHYYDGFTRNTLVRELSHSIPPQMPFAAGLPVSYHYDMNLFASVFYKHLRLDVLDLLHRFTLTFYFALLLLAAFIFLRRWARSDGAALLGTFAVIFGTGGLSWVFAAASGFPGSWGKPFFSFYYLDLVSINPILPALAVLFSGLFCLEEHVRTRRAAWLWPAAFLLAMLTGYKMTFALPVLGALGGAAALAFVRRKERSFIAPAAATALLTAPFLAAARFLNAGGPAFVGRIVFSDWVVFALLDCRLYALADAWGRLIGWERVGLSVPPLALAAVVVFLIGGFGIGLAALPSLLRTTWAARRSDMTAVFLGALFLSSLGLFFWANPFLGERSRNWIVVDIFKLSALVLLVYGARWLGDRLRGRRRAVQAAIAGAVLLALVPNTAEFVRTKRRVPETMIVDARFLEACRYLTERTAPEAVVLHSGSVLFACYFADRRVVLDDSPHSYLDYHLLPAQQEERRADIARFFAAPEANGDVLAKYGVTHVLARRRADAALYGSRLVEAMDIPAGGEAAASGAGSGVRLVTAFSNTLYAVYEVR